MSPMFPLVKQMYDIKLVGYTTIGIKVFVRTDWITAAEYEQITGVPYTL